MQEQFTRDFSLSIPFQDSDGLPVKTNNVFPVFFTDEEYDENQSKLLGRPYFNTVEKIRFLIPGDPTSSPERYATDDDRHKYADHYRKFSQQKEIAESGTPIEHWPILNSSQIATLKYLNIFTVEQIAELSDANLSNIGHGASTLRDQAKAYLETAEQGAVPARLVDENDRLKGEIFLLKEELKRSHLRLEEFDNKLRKLSGQSVVGVKIEQSEPEEPKAPAVEIPGNYKKLKLSTLRSICGKISLEPVLSRDDAINIIDKYLKRVG